MDLNTGNLFNDTQFKTEEAIKLIGRGEIIDSVTPERIMVCAPSNIAIDHLLTLYINNGGLWKGRRDKHNPKILRIGPNIASHLQQYSLETIARKKARGDREGLDGIKKDLLEKCRIVFATLSVAAYKFFQESELTFDTVIVDECAQAVELSTLIPLRYGCKRLILVGDSYQLPPTVKSMAAKEAGYGQSLFGRLESNEEVSK